MDARRATISCDIDFEKQGQQISFLRLMYPDHIHDAGIIPIPIAVFSNGNGPTILLTAGTHGDEHEGQIILRRLLKDINLDTISGRIIIMPALNYPAVLANNVISPLDDGNMNRIFPGEANGSPTSVIAHFVDSVIFPLCDAAIDIHSAGTRGRWIPCAYLCKGKDVDLNRKKLAMTDAFGAPMTVVVGATESSGSVDRAGADRHGISTISLELGGGEISQDTLNLGTEGVYRVLRYLGIMAGDTSDPPQTRYVAFGNTAESNQVFISASGLFEPFVSLGDTVKKGQAAGRVYSLEDLTQPTVELTFPSDGIIVRRLTYALVNRGIYYFTTATEISYDEVI